MKTSVSDPDTNLDPHSMATWIRIQGGNKRAIYNAEKPQPKDRYLSLKS
jgi:hypothetical protein